MFRLGKLLGKGVHGEVFELQDDPTKAIKIAWAPLSISFSPALQTIQKKYNLKQFSFSEIEQTYKFLLHHRIPILATLYSFETLIAEETLQQYAVIMEKLLPLSDDEHRVFESLCREYNGELGNGKFLTHLQELHQWLDFSYVKIFEFYKKVAKLPIIHRDFNRRNIMKDNDGNFKLIDFELVVIKNIQSKNN